LQVLSFHELHGDERHVAFMVVLIDLHDVVMGELGHRARFAGKTRHDLRRVQDRLAGHLERHVAPQIHLPGPEDLPHAPGPKDLLDLVFASNDVANVKILHGSMPLWWKARRYKSP